MAELKTQANEASVADFIASVEDERRRADAEVVLAMMTEASGEAPKMWGKAIIGFGSYHFRYASGREGDWMRIGMSPRKRQLVLYIMDGFDGAQELLERLGKHKTGKSCLYITSLAKVDLDVLRALIEGSLAHMRAQYPTEA
ncbi:MAG: DUF1801 domain-containing protein [Proteobacteria bacterium]|nr:DUF1801 domain-containing protein [Pseudomonadota bacterium]